MAKQKKVTLRTDHALVALWEDRGKTGAEVQPPYTVVKIANMMYPDPGDKLTPREVQGLMAKPGVNVDILGLKS